MENTVKGQEEMESNSGQEFEGQEQGNAEGQEPEMNQDTKQEPEEQKIVRTTALDKRHIPRTIKRIVKDKDILRFDLSIQRGSAWKLQQKSLFIHSLIYGFPFPPAYAQDKGDGFLWMLDGKQRLTTVIDFVENKFKLHKDTPTCFGVEIAGKLFKELPQDFKDEINTTNFTIYQMVEMTDEERDEMFVRLNKGTPLSKIEQTRAMYSDLIEQLEAISHMEFFTDHVLLTKTARNKFTDQELILQTAMLLDENHVLKGIGSPQIEKYVLELKAKGELLSSEVYDKFKKADEYLSVVANELSTDELKSILKKVNVPMVILTALKAVEHEVDASVFADFLVDFLVTNYSKESVYGQAVQSSTGKKENVITRLKEMDNAFVKYVNAKLDKDEEKLKTNLEELNAQVG